MNSMKTVAVIFGSRSAEHDVSIVTALASVIKPLELSGQYQVEAVYIAKDGRWFWDDKLKDISLYQSGEIDDFMRKAPDVHLSFKDGLTLVKSSQFAGRKQYKKVDIVFPATHGTYGEDGSLMGLLEMADVPYVGCGLSASTICMDKVLTKQVAASAGIASTPWIWCTSAEFSANPKTILDRIKPLKYPLFVKPAHLGSSIGISRVENAKELINALEVAAHYDDKIIIEQGVKNLIEVTLPIIGNDTPKVAYLERPMTSSEDFFDFDTKYMQGGEKGKGKSGGAKGAQGYSEIPAKLPKKLQSLAEEVGKQTYSALGCNGIARVDMLIDEKAGKVMLNEVNPLPGGLYAHNWSLAGTSNISLVEQLVQFAEARHQHRQKLATSFSTNYLKQF